MREQSAAYIVGTILLLSGVAWNGEAPAGDTSRGLEQRIYRELARLPNYSVFDSLNFRVQNGTVALSGYVTRPLLKREAEESVARVAGVSEVVNDVEVLPPSFADDGIRLAAYRAIYLEGPLSRYGLYPSPPIRIIVKNGIILLEGVVMNDGERDLAQMEMMSIPGVFEVKNNLRVAAGVAR